MGGGVGVGVGVMMGEAGKEVVIMSIVEGNGADEVVLGTILVVAMGTT